MVQVPLAVRAYERNASMLPESICRNVYVEKDETDPTAPRVVRIQRPGLKQYITLPSANRGLFYSETNLDNRIYAATGGDFVVFESNTYYSLGAITDDGLNVGFAPSFDKIAVSSGGNLYTYTQNAETGARTFGQVEMPDGREVIDVAELNNYIVVACPDGRFYWMVPGENTIDALNFATAESSTDGLVAIQKIGDELYFFGSSSTEIWSATGEEALPFVRSQGRNFTKGLLDRDTVRQMDNTAFWVANNGVVYRASVVPERVSNHGIEERISKRKGVLSALTVTVDAHEFYVLKIPGQGSFAYDAATKQWSEFATLNEDTWRPGSAVMVNTDAYLADAKSGKIWLFDRESNNDDGLQMERVVTGTIELPAKPVRNTNFRLNVGSSVACNYDLRWKDAMGDWSNYVVLRANAGNDRVTAWRLGQAKGQYRTFEIRVLDDARVRIGDADANDSWQR